MKVLITDYEYPQVDQEREIITGFGAELLTCQLKTEAELIEAVQDVDAVIVQYANITRPVIEAMKKCKMVIKYGIGVNNIDADAATEKGIYVCNVPDYGVEEVSNHAIVLMLSLAKKLTLLNDRMRSGKWGYTPSVPLYRLNGSTLGLVGLGRIPSLVAKKMAGFGLNIVAYDPYAQGAAAKELGVTLVDFDTLCKTSDFVSIHCPQTPQTTHLFNSEVFAKMKKTAYLVNTARGPIVDEAALIEALKSGEIAGAGLDVFEEEPLASASELLKLDNVIATPHCAWYSEEAISTLQRKVAEEVVNVLGGNKPFNCTNPAVLAR
ncbi:C-terminal binding protein [Oscillospiraceae bacterium MB08-C2-2]|nr:C-terminal binding protein [Oscillospiraceae bacterium MB08-C2-2]